MTNEVGKYSKRVLAAVLAVMMIVSMVPSNLFSVKASAEITASGAAQVVDDNVKLYYGGKNYPNATTSASLTASVSGTAPSYTEASNYVTTDIVVTAPSISYDWSMDTALRAIASFSPADPKSDTAVVVPSKIYGSGTGKVSCTITYTWKGTSYDGTQKSYTATRTYGKSISIADVSCPTDITLTAETQNLVKGGLPTKITATVAPEGYTGTVTYESSDKNIITVDATGLVTPVAAGQAYVTAKAVGDDADKEFYTKQIAFTVTDPADPTKATDVELNVGSKYELTKGETLALNTVVTPDTASLKKVKWTSSKPAVATVDALTGAVTAVAAGSTVITLTATTGKDASAVTVQVTVNVAEKPANLADFSAYADKTVELVVGSKDAVKNYVQLGDYAVTYASQNDAIASAADGVVTAVAAGTTTVVATEATTGRVATLTVVVKDAEVKYADFAQYNGRTIELTVGETETVSNYVNKGKSDITYTSQNTTTASVADGVVTAVAAGTTTIVAEEKDTGNKATLTVVVKDPDIKYADFTEYADRTVELTVGETETVSNYVNKGQYDVTYTSQNTSTASVAEGVVTAVAAGTTTIVATEATSGRKATLTVVVKNVEKTPADLSGLAEKELTLKAKEEYDLAPFVIANDSGISYSSAEAAIASVNASGKITANKAGTTQIVVTAVTANAEDEKVTIDVTVTETVPAALKTGALTSINLVVGDTYDYSAWIIPNDATITYACTTDMASVDENGVITAKAAGTATVLVSATTVEGTTQLATIEVNVKDYEVNATQIILYNENKNAVEGQTGTITATVKPEDCTDSLVFESSDSETVNIDAATGEYQALKAGTATVTATTYNLAGYPTATNTIEVTVGEYTNAAKTIVAVIEDDEITVGQQTKVSYIVEPEDTTDTIAFKSSNEGVVTVDAAGSVTGVAPGTAYITVYSTENSDVYDLVKVKVLKNADLVNVPDSITIVEGYTFDLSAHVALNDDTVTYTVDENDYISVDKYGVVKGLKYTDGVATLPTVHVASAADLANFKDVQVTVKADETYVQVLGISAETREFWPGESGKVTASYIPADATDTVLFYTDDTDVIDLNSVTGEFYALKSGTASIRVNSVDVYGAQKAEASLTIKVLTPSVIEAKYPSIALDLNPETNSYILGDKVTFTTEGDDTTVIYSSDDESIATVDEAGVIKAVSAGVTFVTAKVLNDPATDEDDSEAVVVVTVTEDGSYYYLGTETKVVKASVKPETAQLLFSTTAKAEVLSDLEFTAETEDTDIVDIISTEYDGSKGDNNYVEVAFVAKTTGTALIKVTNADGFYGYIVVYVSEDPAEVVVSENSVALWPNEKAEVSAFVLPEKADQTITWVSNDPDIASVEDGVITANKSGSTVIYAQSANYPETETPYAKAKIYVTVYKPANEIDFDVEDDLLTLDGLGDYTYLDVVALEEDADDTSINYTVSDGITFDEKTGKVTATVKSGLAKIIAEVENDPATAADNAKAVLTVLIGTEPIELGEITLKVGQTGTKSDEILEELSELDTTDWAVEEVWTEDRLTYDSTDDDVVTVDAKGTYTAEKVGSAIVVATTDTGIVYYWTVKVVTADPTAVELSDTEIAMWPNHNFDVNAAVVPSTANQTIVWTSEDETVATVDKDGIITSVGAGSTVIWATPMDAYGSPVNAAAAKVFVTVYEPAKAIVDTESADTITLVVGGDSDTFGIKALANTAKDQTILWTNLNEDLFTVEYDEASHQVKFTSCDKVGEGIARAYIENDPETETDDVRVTYNVKVVSSLPTAVEATETELTLWPDHKVDVDAAVVPATANQTIIWTSEDETIATVDKDGIITSVAAGSTIVWATPMDAYGSPVNAAAAKVYVTVYEAATAITDDEDVIVRLDSFGASETRTVTVAEATAYDQKINWVNLNQDLFTVEYDEETQQIKFTAGNKKGYGSVTGYIENDPETETDDVEITYAVVVGKISLELGDETVEVGKTDSKAVLEDELANATPGEATPQTTFDGNFTLNSDGVWVGDGYYAGQTVTFASSNENYVSVDPVTGVWTGIAPTSSVDEGHVWVIATSSNGTQWIWKVTVVPSTAEGVEASLDKAVIWPTETAQITASVLPSTAVQDVEYDYDSSIVSVSDKGLVTPTGAAFGDTTIKAYAVDVDGNRTDVYAELKLTVLKPATAITFDVNPVELAGKNQYDYSVATVADADADDKSVDYTVSDTISYDAGTGKVTALVKNGVGTVVAHIENDPATDVDDVTETLVVKIGTDIADISDVVIHVGESSSYFNTLMKALAKLDDDWADVTWTFKTYPTTIATIDEAGTYTGVAVGTATAYATTSDGYGWMWNIKVVPADPTAVVIDGSTNVTLWPKVGTVVSCNQYQINASVTPAAAIQKLDYKSADDSIATVDANGLVTALSAGDTEITVTAYYYDTADDTEKLSTVSATVYVTVKQPAEALEITCDDIGFTAGTPGELLLTYFGDTAQLIGTVTPENADDTKVIWWSSDDDVASVDENGLVTAHNTPGTVEIYGMVANDPCAEHTKDDVVAYIRVTVIDPSYWELSVDPENIERYPYDVDVRPDERFNLDVTATLKNAPKGTETTTIPTITYKVTEGEGIVSVDKNGLVTPLKPGKAVVTSYIFEGTTKEVSVNTYINVLQPVESIGITLKGSDKVITKYEMRKGTTQYFDVLFNDGLTVPSDTSVTWKMSDSTVASIDEYGKVTALKVGKTTLYVYSNNQLRAECVITVIQLATKISVNQTSVCIYPDESAMLTWTLSPSDVSEKKVTWTSSDESVAIVYSNGRIKAIAPGKCVVTGTCETRSGVKAAYKTIQVTVKAPATSVKITSTSNKFRVTANGTNRMTLTIGNSAVLTAKVNAKAYDKTVTWTSSNPGIASVDQFGIVTAHKKGKVTIYATTHNSISALCHVEVKDVSYDNMSGVTAVDQLFVRKDASISAVIIGQYPYAGTALTIVGKKGEWYKIKYNDGYGWVNAGYVTITSSEDSDESTIKSNAVITEETSIYLGLGVNVFTTAPSGTRVLIIGSSGSYYHITFGTSNVGTGWVVKSAVKKDAGFKTGKATVITVNGVLVDGMGSSTNVVYGGSVTRKAVVINRNSSGVFVYSGINTAYKTYKKLARVYYGEKLTVLTDSINGWYQVQAADGTIGFIDGKNIKIKNTYYSSKTYTNRGTVNAEALNVRAGASSDAEVIGLAKKGTELTITGQYGSYYEINWMDGMGYVLKKYVDLKTVKVSSSTGWITPTAAKVVVKRANIMASSSINSKVVGSVTIQNSLRVVGSKGNYYRVVTNRGTTGYILKSCVKLTTKNVNIVR